ncbi:DUF5693 family protein [Bacillaceae bacterium]
MIRRILWAVTALCLLASIPLIGDRRQAENSVKSVEVVVEYDEVMKVATRIDNFTPPGEIMQQLKANGVTTVALSEQTLRSLDEKDIVNLYGTTNALLLSDGKLRLPPQTTFVLFNPDLSPAEKRGYATMIAKTFGRLVVPYTLAGKDGFLIRKPVQAVQDVLLGIDLNEAKKIKETYGLQVLARLDAERPWNEAFLSWQFAALHNLGIKKILFSGKEVLGFPKNLDRIAGWLQSYDMSMGLIDFYEQNGAKKLAQLSGLRTFRVMSVSQKEMTSKPASELSDMLSLAANERNVRMFYLHLPLENKQLSAEAIVEKTSAVLQATKADVEKGGLSFRETSPFTIAKIREKGWHNLVLIVGLLALASLLAEKYDRRLLYLALPGGLLLYALGQWKGQEILVFQLLALLAAIVAPTLATLLALEWVRKQRSERHPVLRSLVAFLFACAVSWYGAICVVSLLNNLVFVQYLEQFRGVKLLYFAPVVLVLLYLAVKGTSWPSLGKTIPRLLNHPLQVKHVLLAAAALAALGYFLARSGNNAAVLPYELEFRQWLNDLFGVRPRTKEIFIGHPLFLFASYLMLKYKQGSWLFSLGVIGQMSMVSTFTHLHTPLFISVLRTWNGMLAGIAAGLGLILLWEAWQSLQRRVPKS